MLLGIFQVFLTYHRRFKFDSVLHMENDDVLYGISAINVEFSLISRRRRRRFQSDTKSGRFILPTGRSGDLTKFRESPGESGRLNMYVVNM